jgi:hypothetical protein
VKRLEEATRRRNEEQRAREENNRFWKGFNRLKL